MARSADELVILTFWQIVAGVFGICLLAVTLWYTRQATNAATSAAGAARDAVEITATTAQKQLRAYVSLMKASLEWQADRTIRTEITFKNNGLTPAYKFHIVHGRGITKEELGHIGSFPVVAKVDLGPGATMKSSLVSEIINESLWEDFIAGKTPLFCWGEVKYVDAFEVEKFTKYRLMLDPSENAWLACDEGNTSN